MIWKVYHIQSCKIVKAGFESDDEAGDWLLSKFGSDNNSYEVEEMDEDEWIEYQDERAKILAEQGIEEDDEDEGIAQEDIEVGNEYGEQAALEDDDYLTTVDDDDL